MKALEVFTPKEVRTCARVIKKFTEAGYQIHELPSVVDHMGELGRLQIGLKFPASMEVKAGNLTADQFMAAIGWQVLRSWFKVWKALNKLNLTNNDVKKYVSVERRRYLGKMTSGRVGT